MSDEETEPLALQLAKDGVESETAFRAATEAEKARHEAERKKLENQSTLETVLQEIDIGEILNTVIKAASTAALTGQQAAQQPAEPAQSNQPQSNQPTRSPETPSPKSPLHKEAENIEMDDEN